MFRGFFCIFIYGFCTFIESFFFLSYVYYGLNFAILVMTLSGLKSQLWLSRNSLYRSFLLLYTLEELSKIDIIYSLKYRRIFWWNFLEFALWKLLSCWLDLSKGHKTTQTLCCFLSRFWWVIFYKKFFHFLTSQVYKQSVFNHILLWI